MQLFLKDATKRRECAASLWTGYNNGHIHVGDSGKCNHLNLHLLEKVWTGVCLLTAYTLSFSSFEEVLSLKQKAMYCLGI